MIFIGFRYQFSIFYGPNIIINGPKSVFHHFRSPGPGPGPDAGPGAVPPPLQKCTQKCTCIWRPLPSSTKFKGGGILPLLATHLAAHPSAALGAKRRKATFFC